MDDFQGKLAVITGGASGVGLAIAAALGREGARVVLADVEAAALESATTHLANEGITADGIVTDVSKQDSVDALAQAVGERHGDVHILCNNAGVGAFEDKPAWELPLEDWRWTLDVNLWGVIHGMRSFLPAMLAHGQSGHIVNTSSGNGGLTLVPSTPIYSASKSAVSSLTESLHLQLAQAGAKIRASILYPGPNMVETNIFTAYRNRPGELQRAEKQGQPPSLEDIKAIVSEMGQELPTSTPEEVAGHFMDGLKGDAFWILPMSERTEEAVRERFTNILERRTPRAPQGMF